MSDKQAILNRQSRRTFYGELPSIDQIRMLQNMIDKINAEENLSIQLMIDESDGFNNIKSSYGMFIGVRNYIALVGKKSDENVHEKLGYYGEMLLLTCERLGLGTCWVGGTYDRKQCVCKVEEDETFVCCIVFGNTRKKATIKEKVTRNILHTMKKDKAIKDLFYSEGDKLPNWFIEGMRMVQRAPSAVNAMPVRFYYSNGSVYAKVNDPKLIQLYDLGIAKYHFEVGAECGRFEFGNGGAFIKDE